VGPVFSYYEFALDGVEGGQLPRLNDDEWKEMLETDDVTSLHPYWVLDIYGIIDPLYLPEFLNPVTVMLFASALLTVFSIYTKKFLKRRKPQNLRK